MARDSNAYRALLLDGGKVSESSIGHKHGAGDIGHDRKVGLSKKSVTESTGGESTQLQEIDEVSRLTRMDAEVNRWRSSRGDLGVLPRALDGRGHYGSHSRHRRT